VGEKTHHKIALWDFSRSPAVAALIER